MNKSRSGFILFIQIIFSIGIVAFLARLALISTGSWLWLAIIFASLSGFLILEHLGNRVATQLSTRKNK
ncbi:MAG: hypothetical protein UW41_C0012G0016 [Candidatus Collierbacteria bacterium GW2011_GWC2_44_18]|uniref:Uncharacterized protein n=1 Tax=Candidatus Collierbacteria bacterium GW2011_GWC2_44_18 TaxID=1618392 RepID=A0A0G1HQX8_9BACT|nr:MAG: hypothetical protein UW16_C0031G0024 [Microgenomates group bacterium GW2011_GWC1_44_10]KKT49078.1 MAG: hypothetical protein UW41_C0012G0016 [Candidatus Collierbacteria bacterium GW2011_GWC2_44_18]